MAGRKPNREKTERSGMRNKRKTERARERMKGRNPKLWAQLFFAVEAFRTPSKKEVHNHFTVCKSSKAKLNPRRPAGEWA